MIMIMDEWKTQLIKIFNYQSVYKYGKINSVSTIIN
jgi:hypothetical protein